MFAMLSTDKQIHSNAHSNNMPFFKRVNHAERYSQSCGDNFSPQALFKKAELNQENTSADTTNTSTDTTQALPQANTPAKPGCSYTVEYGNPRIASVPSCGGQVEFDILQVKSSDKNCQKGLKGKLLSEVVTTDNNCFPTKVTTGPPVLLGDNGIPVNPATDTYGINMPRANALDCKYGIPCQQEMKQELSVDGQLATTNIIRFDMCGDSSGCVTRIFFNRLFLGTVGTGEYKFLSKQQEY